MRVLEFINELRFGLDRANVLKLRGGAPVATFIAPNSGFAGPQIRPHYLGDNENGEGRYSISRRQAERILVMFDVTLPPRVVE